MASVLHLPSLTLTMPTSSTASTSPPLPPASASSVLRDEHALLAAYETRPTRPKRSSSERSKEFRAKRKKYEGELQAQVDTLRREVAELTMRRNITQEKLVHMRSNVSGSLIKVVREYYLVFQHGLELNPESPKANYQLDFLRQSFDENVCVNGRIGLPTLVQMWRNYTIAQTNLFLEVGDVTLVGPDDDPVVLLCTKAHTQLTVETFETMFPTAVRDETLINKFMGKQVTYQTWTYFRFNAEGRIGFVDFDVGLFQALMDIAPRIEDAITLMDRFECTPLERWTIDSSERNHSLDMRVKVDTVEITATPATSHTRREPIVSLTMSNDEKETKLMASATKAMTPSSDTESDDSGNERRKHSMNFLLS